MWLWGNRRIYLDHASATPVMPEAARASARASAQFGNPGSIHAEGVASKRVLEEARERIAEMLACKAREVVFVSGGTEANNLAILGVARHLSERSRREDALDGTHWIVSSIEHPSVLECFADIEHRGGEVSFVDPDSRGSIAPETVANAVRENTVLLSIGWANHEIGVVQPIRDIVRAVREKNKRTLVHADAGQAPLYLSPQVHTLGVDLFSIDSGKLYGPRGIGALYVSNRASLLRVMRGGSQERGLRAGTENSALVAGFAEAFVLTQKERERETVRLRKLRDAFVDMLKRRIPDMQVNGAHRTLPHMLNISIPGIQSEYVTLALDTHGIAISTKSACREGEEASSHVVAMLGGDEWRAQNTLRFSLGRSTRARDLVRTADTLAGILSRIKE